jgi:hypothetical protein
MRKAARIAAREKPIARSVPISDQAKEEHDLAGAYRTALDRRHASRHGSCFGVTHAGQSRV